MFVYSVRATTIRFFGVVCIALAALITLIAFVPVYVNDAPAAPTAGDGQEKKISYDKVRSAKDAETFLAQFGWEVNADAVQTVQVTIPAEFDKIFTGYNELQKRQGLDLAKFRNKAVLRYTFPVTNYPGENGTVYANVLVYRNRVIGGDLCTADVTGFVRSFEGN